MSAEHGIRSVNLGCGDQGLEWMARNKPGTLYFGVDQRRFTTPHTNYVLGEATHLPLKDNSINKIFADYYFNDIGKTTIREFLANPQELLKSKYPSRLHEWFMVDIQKNYSVARDHLIHIKEILQLEALREVSRILAPYGTITVVDKPFVVRWLVEQAWDHTSLYPEAEDDLTPDDFERSHSLTMLKNEHNEPARKVRLRKLYAVKKTA